MVSRSENREYLDALRLLCAEGGIDATPIGLFSRPLDSPFPSITGLGTGTGWGIEVLVSDALDETGTTVMELVVEDADEDTMELVRAVPNCMAGIVGTGGIPEAANEALLVSRSAKLGEGTECLICVESDVRRLWLGWRRWRISGSTAGLGGVAATAAVIDARLVGLISKSSCELVELLELPTGETATSLPFCEPPARDGPVDPWLEARLARPESTMILSTSFPFPDTGAKGAKGV